MPIREIAHKNLIFRDFLQENALVFMQLHRKISFLQEFSMKSLQLADTWILQVLISIVQNSAAEFMESDDKFSIFCIK